MAVFGVQPFVRGALTVLIVVASIELLGLGDPGVGLLNAAIGLGGIVGSVGTILLVGRHRLALVFLLALVVWGLPISVMGLVPLAWVAVAAMVVVGLANAVLDVAGFTTLQRIIPNDVRASVLGVFEGNVAAMARDRRDRRAGPHLRVRDRRGPRRDRRDPAGGGRDHRPRRPASADDIALVPERQCQLLARRGDVRAAADRARSRSSPAASCR